MSKKHKSIISIILCVLAVSIIICGCSDSEIEYGLTKDFPTSTDTTSTYEVNSNSSYSGNVLQIAEEALTEKYGLNFEPLPIQESKTELVFVDNNDLCFTVIVDNQGYVDDNYINRIIADSLSKDISSCFSDLSIDACCFTIISSDDYSNETDVNISIEEFNQKYNIKDVKVYVPMRSSDLTNALLNNAINKLCVISKDKEIEMAVSFIAMDGESYNTCALDMESTAVVNDKWLDRYTILSRVDFIINRADISPSISEISAQLIN